MAKTAHSAPSCACNPATPAIKTPESNRDMHPDHTILAAFKRFQDGHVALEADPGDRPEPGSVYTATHQAIWNEIDAAEIVIEETRAHTPQGVACKLWLAMIHTSDDAEVEQATIQADLSWFEQQGDALDWNLRLIVSALRSLTSVAASPVGEA
ncbi:MAG: hypothetical protein IT550_08645 [Novosphingobium sp.]|jgi:hypothetical protein|nr:hypothetical protein [Novosphingobium sp.]